MPVTHGVASSSLVQTANNIQKALQVKYLRGFVFGRDFHGFAVILRPISS